MADIEFNWTEKHDGGGNLEDYLAATMGTLVVAITEPMARQIAELVEDVVLHRMGHYLADTIEGFDEDRFYSLSIAAMNHAIESIQVQDFVSDLMRAYDKERGVPNDPRQN